MNSKQVTAPRAESGAISTQANPSVVLRIIFFLSATIILYGLQVHEPWRDEAQGWLIVRDNSITQWLALLPYEGHPPLWYLLITPLAKLGMPYASQNYLAAGIMLSAIYLFLFKTKLPLLVKCLLPFGCFMMYDYAVFARSYCLLAFFTAALLVVYPNRFEKPWLFAACVAGLFNTHVVAFSFALCITAVFLWDAINYGKQRATIYGAVGLMLLSGLYLIPYLYASPIREAIKPEDINYSSGVLKMLGTGITGMEYVMPGIILLLLVIAYIITRVKPFVILLVGIVGMVYILVASYSSSIRHFGMLVYMIVFVWGIMPYYHTDKLRVLKFDSYKPYLLWVLPAILVLHVVAGLQHLIDDISQRYSSAHYTSVFLKEYGVEDKILAGGQAWALSAIAPYLPDKQFYYTECGRWGTFYHYDSCYADGGWQLPVSFAVDAAHDKFSDRLQDVIFVLNYPVPPEGMRYLDLLHQPEEIPIRPDEAFYIYKFKDGVK